MNFLDRRLEINTVWYLSSPYSSNDSKTKQLRFEEVVAVASTFFEAKRNVFSPIIYCHPIAPYLRKSASFKSWFQFDYIMLDLCQHLLVLTLPGWQESIGVAAEIKYALSKGYPVIYINENLDII